MATITKNEPGLKATDRLFIDGDWIKPSGGGQFDVIMPSTEELFYSVPSADEHDVNRAVAAAREAFDHGPWPRLSHAERADFIQRIGEELERRSAQFANVWTGQMGIVNWLANASIPYNVDAYKFYANLGRTFPFEERYPDKSGNGISLLVREPVGVVAAIIPWNAPITIIAYKVAPALLAGCTVVLKASPEAPGEAYLMAEIAEAVGLPKGVLNVLTADRDVSEALVRHSGIDKVGFTGSTAAGRRIASICGERIARYTLELGGKSAAVILDDYDIETAAKTLAGAARHLNGQVCAMLSRVIVSRKRHDEFVEALASEYAATRVGDPYDSETQMGPLAMARQRDRAESLIATAQSEGATLATGGGRPKHLNRGYYIEPTVFANVDNRSTIAREEVFGPVLSVIAAEDENDALNIANDTIFGLNASVFTNDIERAYQAGRQIRSGTVGHNGFYPDFGIAFGGFKQSGIGREGGVEGLMSYLEVKMLKLDGDTGHSAAVAKPDWA